MSHWVLLRTDRGGAWQWSARVRGWRWDRRTKRGAEHKPGGREGLPISLPLNGGGREALSTAGQPGPLAWLGVHHPGLVPIQKQPAEHPPPHTAIRGTLCTSPAPFSPSRFSFLTAASFGSGRHHNHLGLSCLPCRLPPPLPQNLDCHLPALHLCYSVLDLGLPALCNPSTNVLQGLADPLVPGALPLPQLLGPGPWIPLTCLGRGGGLPLISLILTEQTPVPHPAPSFHHEDPHHPWASKWGIPRAGRHCWSYLVVGRGCKEETAPGPLLSPTRLESQGVWP